MQVDQVVCVNLRAGNLSFWDFALPLAFCLYVLGSGRLMELHPFSSVYSRLTLTVVGWNRNWNQFTKSIYSIRKNS